MRASKNESGFALILAILALMLLTFLGMTLVATTSTELQIATNYRWSQQALYNAEAGVEAAKEMLRGYDWLAVVPDARITTWNGSMLPPNPNTPGGGVVAANNRNDNWGNASRNFENWECDAKGNGVGYGVVLDDGGPAGPSQYQSTLLGNNIMGATTLWVRRPTWHNMDGTLKDLSDIEDADADDLLILTVEGIAPFTGSAATLATSASNRAVQVVEVVLRKQTTLAAGPCGTRAGQAGGGAEGAGFSGCDPITGAGVVSGMPAGSVTGGGADDTTVK
jgi:PilX N-terminal